MAIPTTRIPDPADAPPLRWGVLGPGWIAEQFVTALHRHTRQRLAAVGSRDAERAASFASKHGAERAYGNYEQLVADPSVDAIYVATPHSEHRAHALLSIAAGKPTLVEKPFTRNAGEAREVIEAARESRVPLLEAMWTRFLPHMDVVRQLLDDGALGTLETVIADHGQWFAEDHSHRLYDPALAGGALLDLGVYPVSFADFALGSPGEAMAAGTRTGTGVDRQLSAILHTYPAHPHAHAVVTTTLAAFTPTTASISGDAARVEIPGPFYGPRRIVFVPRGGEPEQGEAPAMAGHDGLSYEAAHFATMLGEGRTESEILPLDDTLAVMATMDELRRQVGITLPGE